jgi:hypothetical protein
MTARSTMTDLILSLRGMTSAGTADYSIVGVAFWSDDQLQMVLDRHRLHVYHEPLDVVQNWDGGGSVSYTDYYSGRQNLEADAFLEDSLGADVGTALYTADYNTGRFVFAADTAGTAYYLTGKAYDLNGAAADVWRQKAAHLAASGSFDWSSDNMSMKRSQQVAQAREMAAWYAAFAWPVTVTLTRSDTR